MFMFSLKSMAEDKGNVLKKEIERKVEREKKVWPNSSEKKIIDFWQN